MTDQSKKAKAEKDGRMKVKIAPNPFPTEEIYVDGVAGIMSRGGVFKIDCYRVAGVDEEDNAEVRRMTHKLVLPASAMPEFVQAVQGLMKQMDKKQAEDK